MAYVDGFIIAVPKKRIGDYRKMAKACSKIWMEYGATSFYESVADDVSVGKLTSFPRSVKMKKDETVVFSWITYKSRAQRDKVNKQVMKDPRIAKMMGGGKPPFDSKRMIYGGFKIIVEA